ncbi:PREDICTED: uncharacterized protein LOC104790758 [Camelina sativa]|uniref:Uncharacterized protein LOC104790758 n=1 Tax=Camelina sativa TaxID=90675 RepID=A0ABM0ZF16_CAMSA|nr:PREDICTED: uncharacterized protein LOC104790758 [Camelina sativa]
MVQQGVFHNDGGWEKPRKYVKRALDFQAHVPSVGVENSSSYHQNRHHGSVWDQKRSHGAGAMVLGGKRGVQVGSGEQLGQALSFPLNRKGSGSAWPKPLYKAKSGQKDQRMQEVLGEDSAAIGLVDSQRDTVMESSSQYGAGEELVGSDFNEATDDLLEEGESPNGNYQEEGEVAIGQGNNLEEGLGSGSTDPTEDDLKGDGHKKRGKGIQRSKATDGKPAGGGRPVKKGMVALPKPPAHT